MKIYFCHEQLEDIGLYVIAKTRGSAKEIYASEVGCHFCEVRCTDMKRICRPNEAEGVIDEGSRLLKKYGLEYAEE